MRLSPYLNETDRLQTFGRRTSRSFYAVPVSEFLLTDDEAAIGNLPIFNGVHP